MYIYTDKTKKESCKTLFLKETIKYFYIQSMFVVQSTKI